MSKRYQCQRRAKGYGPIRIRVVVNSSVTPTPTPELLSPATIEVCTTIEMGTEKKNKRALMVRKRLEQVREWKEIQDENDALQNQLDESKKKLKSAQTMLSRCREQQTLIPNSNPEGDPFVKLCRGIDKVFSVHYPGKHAQTKAKLLLEALSSGVLFHGEGVALLNDMKRLYVRQIFKDWKVLKAFDCSSIGAFKTSTVKALHSVLDNEKVGLFPSPSSIDRARQLLDKYAMETVGCRREMTKYGEVYFLNADRAIRLLLKSTGLYEKAQRTSVSISVTADGALLLNSRTHVSCGVKVTDVNGIHPITKLPLAISIDDEEKENVFNCMQSRELCAILVMADAKDSKELYNDVFREFYNYAEKLRIYGMEASDGEPALKPFTVTHPQDMKSTQTVCKRGGNCKMKHYFCHLCSCTKHCLASFRTNENRCERCLKRNRTKCYHIEVCDSTRTEMLLHDLEYSVGEYYETYKKDFHLVQKETKLLTDPTLANREQDIHHIDFIIPDNCLIKRREYTQFIGKECMLRKLNMHGKNVMEWREMLRVCVQLEQKIQFLLNVRQWHQEGVEKVPLVEFVELLIPCILHLENRIGEKIVTMIIRLGLEKSERAASVFITELQEVFQKEVLGSVESPSQWKIPFKRESDGSIQLGPIQERNAVIREMMKCIDKIIEGAIPEREQAIKTKLVLACAKYSDAMKILTAHRLLMEEEQDHFQDLIDDFFESWLEMFGNDGMTNYLHLLGSGHVLYFLKKYKCLYIYSQQGWEALNSICTAYILQNSSRGGFGSGQNGKKSYIFPLIRYIMRDLLWKTTMADSFFIDKEENRSNASY
jgi:hypothetical protein